MGQIFSHSNQDHDSSLKRSPSNSASSALLKQTISQNMRLSKSKVSSLLKANHMNHSIVHRNHFYNTLPHHIGAAYLFGATPQRLFDIYDEESKSLEPWIDSPHEVTRVDWNRWFGDKRYARAYLDFFEDEVVRSNYDWKRVVQRYVIEGDEPLLSGMISGACHPLIHLAYAYELNNVEVATEALAVSCVDRDFLYKYVDAKQKYKSFSRNPSPVSQTKPVLEILDMMRTDKRFDGLFESPGYWNLPILFASREEIVLEYFNLFSVTRPETNLEELFDISILLLAATTPAPSYPSPSRSTTHPSTNDNSPTSPSSTSVNEKGTSTPQPHFDFFLLHLLLSCHAIRVLFKNLPFPTHNTMLEAQFLATIAYYVSELRPEVKVGNIRDLRTGGKDGGTKGLEDQEQGQGDTQERDWSFVRRRCFEGDVQTEVANGGNYVRALRALREGEMEYGYKDGLYLNTALMIVDQMMGNED